MSGKTIDEAVVKAAQDAYNAARDAGWKPCPRCRGTRRERDNYTECSECEGEGKKWDESAPNPMLAALTAAQQQGQAQGGCMCDPTGADGQACPDATGTPLCFTAPPSAPVGVEALCQVYYDAYHAGHHDTVEGVYVDVFPVDRDTYWQEKVEEDYADALAQQPAAVDGAATNSAVAAIQFALKDPEGMTFLRLWNEGEFDTLRREWPDAPVEVYIGADPLAAQHQEPKS